MTLSHLLFFQLNFTLHTCSKYESMRRMRRELAAAREKVMQEPSQYERVPVSQLRAGPHQYRDIRPCVVDALVESISHGGYAPNAVMAVLQS